MIKFIKIIWEYIIPIFTPLLIYYCALKIPLGFKVIPEEYVFDVNIATYSAIVVIIKKVADWIIKEHKKKLSNISVIASKDESNSINQYLELDFNNDFVTVFIKIILDGEPKRLKAEEISIFFPRQVFIQLTERSRNYCVLDDDSKSIRIDVKKLFNIDKKDIISGDSVSFDIRVNKIDKVVESKAEISLTKGSNMTKLEKNVIFFTK